MLGAASPARSAVCLSDQLTGSCQSRHLTPADDNNQLCVTDSPRGSLSPVEETAETISTTTHRWRTTSGRRAHGSIATATELWTGPVRTRPAHHVTKSMFGYRAVVARYTLRHSAPDSCYRLFFYWFTTAVISLFATIYLYRKTLLSKLTVHIAYK